MAQYVRSVREVLPYLEDMRALLMEGSMAEQKSFIKSFVREIVVEGRNAFVRYALPVP